MTALSADRNTPQRAISRLSLPAKAANKFFAGAIAMLDLGGYLRKGAAGVNMRGAGRVAEFVDNTNGQDGDVRVEIERGCFRYANSASTDEITAADIGATAWIVDDQTVAKTDGGNARSPAGKIVDVESAGVWVEIGEPGDAQAMGIPGFTIGAETSNVITVAIQLRDKAGRDLVRRGAIDVYLSDDANGDSIVATAPDGGIAAGADGLYFAQVASKAGRLVSESDGDIDLAITHAAGAKTVYLIVVMPDGTLVPSSAITFA